MQILVYPTKPFLCKILNFQCAMIYLENTLKKGKVLMYTVSKYPVYGLLAIPYLMEDSVSNVHISPREKTIVLDAARILSQHVCVMKVLK